MARQDGGAGGLSFFSFHRLKTRREREEKRTYRKKTRRRISQRKYKKQRSKERWYKVVQGRDHLVLARVCWKNHVNYTTTKAPDEENEIEKGWSGRSFNARESSINLL